MSHAAQVGLPSDDDDFDEEEEEEEQQQVPQRDEVLNPLVKRLW